MRDNDYEWECPPGGGLGLRESMDAAGFAASLPEPSEPSEPSEDDDSAAAAAVTVLLPAP